MADSRKSSAIRDEPHTKKAQGDDDADKEGPRLLTVGRQRSSQGQMTGRKVSMISRFRKRSCMPVSLETSQSSLMQDWDAHGRKKDKPKLAPTYRMAPVQESRFRPWVAASIMRDVLRSYLQNERYNKNIMGNWACNIAEVVKERMKIQNFSKRYKYVCVVTLGQKLKKQSTVVASRCLWDAVNDNHASASIIHADIFAVATIFASYTE